MGSRPRWPSDIHLLMLKSSLQHRLISSKACHRNRYFIFIIQFRYCLFSGPRATFWQWKAVLTWQLSSMDYLCACETKKESNGSRRPVVWTESVSWCCLFSLKLRSVPQLEDFHQVLPVAQTGKTNPIRFTASCPVTICRQYFASVSEVQMIRNLSCKPPEAKFSSVFNVVGSFLFLQLYL